MCIINKMAAVSLRFGSVCEEDPDKILSDLKIYTTAGIDTFFVTDEVDYSTLCWSTGTLIYLQENKNELLRYKQVKPEMTSKSV